MTKSLTFLMNVASLRWSIWNWKYQACLMGSKLKINGSLRKRANISVTWVSPSLAPCYVSAVYLFPSFPCVLKTFCCPLCATFFVSSSFCTMWSGWWATISAQEVSRFFFVCLFLFHCNWLDGANWNFYLKGFSECGWGTYCLAVSAVKAESIKLNSILF